MDTADKVTLGIIITSTLIFILLIISTVIGTSLGYGNRMVDFIDIQETSIEIVSVSSKDGTTRKKYVYSNDDVYSVEDRLWIGYVDSMTTYNELRKNEGKTCKVELVGTRNGRFSQYRNIVKVISCD